MLRTTHLLVDTFNTTRDPSSPRMLYHPNDFFDPNFYLYPDRRFSLDVQTELQKLIIGLYRSVRVLQPWQRRAL